MTKTTIFPMDRMEMKIPHSWRHRNGQGMSWFLAAVFIVGDMMGGGLIALPVAVMNTGLIMGIILLTLGAVFSLYTGLQLGHSWAMMQSRWPEYQDHCRKPYPEIAYRAMGTRARNFVSVIMCISQFGIMTVLIILAATNIDNFMATIFDVHWGKCIFVLLIGVAVWPLTMLHSPMDFWQAAVAAAGFSVLAAAIIFSGSLVDAPDCISERAAKPLSITDMFLGYGTIIFAYGGHAAFPTIQHDMVKPFRFNRSVWSSYIFIYIAYLITAITAYEIYGNSLNETVMMSIQTKWMAQAVNLLITLHVLPTIIIIFSPLTQQLEEWVGVPIHFSSKRFFIRTATLMASLFLGLTIPRFGIFMDLVGGTTMTLMTMILPSIYFLFLNASQKKRQQLLENKEITEEAPDNQHASFKEIFTHTPKHILYLNILSITFGVLGGIAVSVSSIYTITHQAHSGLLEKPCYIQWITDGLSVSKQDKGIINCCGEFKNISIHGDISLCR